MKRMTLTSKTHMCFEYFFMALNTSELGEPDSSSAFGSPAFGSPASDLTNIWSCRTSDLEQDDDHLNSPQLSVASCSELPLSCFSDSPIGHSTAIFSSDPFSQFEPDEDDESELGCYPLNYSSDENPDGKGDSLEICKYLKNYKGEDADQDVPIPTDVPNVVASSPDKVNLERLKRDIPKFLDNSGIVTEEHLEWWNHLFENAGEVYATGPSVYTGPYRKASNIAEVDNLWEHVAVGAIVAVHLENYDKIPVIGKVIEKGETTFKMHYFKGSWNKKWVPWFCQNKDPWVDDLPKECIFLAAFELNENGKLQVDTKRQIREFYTENH